MTIYIRRSIRIYIYIYIHIEKIQRSLLSLRSETRRFTTRPNGKGFRKFEGFKKTRPMFTDLLENLLNRKKCVKFPVTNKFALAATVLDYYCRNNQILNFIKNQML